MMKGMGRNFSFSADADCSYSIAFSEKYAVCRRSRGQIDSDITLVTKCCRVNPVRMRLFFFVRTSTILRTHDAYIACVPPSVEHGSSPQEKMTLFAKVDRWQTCTVHSSFCRHSVSVSLLVVFTDDYIVVIFPIPPEKGNFEVHSIYQLRGKRLQFNFWSAKQNSTSQ